MEAERIIAAVMIEMAETNREIGSISDICEQIKKTSHRPEIITLQRTPRGFHSREVAEFIGRLLTVGILTQVQPTIIFSKKGLDSLKEKHSKDR